MNYLLSGKNSLSYTLSIPKGGQSRCCVVFVHAAEGNKLGPHRMFVELERVLNKNEIASLRFDLAGCGDSTGQKEYDQNRDICNVDDILKYLSKERKIDKIVLLGMSRGAYTVFKYSQTCCNNISGAILLSLPVSSSKAIKKALFFRVKEYLLKLTSPKTYVKLINNKINYSLVFRTIFQVFSNKRKYSLETADSLPAFPALLVYGEKDPMTSESKNIYLPLFKSAGSDVECRIIQEANHSFFHYKWKEDIMEIILKWLKERF